MIGVLTVAYFIVGKLALQFAFLNASARPVWPSAGIALAALLVLDICRAPAEGQTGEALAFRKANCNASLPTMK